MNEAAAKRAFPIIFSTRLLDAIGFGIIMPVMPALLMEVGEMPLADATRAGGALFVTYALLQFLCGPLMGRLSDQFGRRPVILASLAAFAIDYAFMALAPSLAWLRPRPRPQVPPPRSRCGCRCPPPRTWPRSCACRRPWART
jgi:DHA1 family tetracycline resistance protein-like MFS transporter